MTKILFVCHGNICRSPMAEFITAYLAEQQGLQDRLFMESAATSREEIGNPVHPGAREKLCQAGISCQGKRARQLTPQDYESFDLLIAMDGENVRNMRRMLGGDPRQKIHKLLEYCGETGDVADPWYTGDFDAAWRDISRGCRALLEAWKKGDDAK